MAKNTAKTATATKKPVSKKSQAIKIVNRMTSRQNVPARAEILKELTSKLGLSQNCAATYYQNVKSGKWS